MRGPDLLLPAREFARTVFALTLSFTAREGDLHCPSDAFLTGLRQSGYLDPKDDVVPLAPGTLRKTPAD